MSSPYQDQIDQLNQDIDQNKDLLDDPELKELAQQEIDRLEKEVKMLEDAATQLEAAQQADNGDLAPGAKPTNCIIEIRPGAGGDEAKIWANDLMRMYVRFAETQGLKIEYIDDLVFKVKGKVKWSESALDEFEKVADEAEVESGTESETGEETMNPNSNKELPTTPYTALKLETGVHRVQRVPETESQGRIHTSTASVAVLPEVSTRSVEIRDEDLEWQFMRSSGAGGQNVNKVNSAVRLTHVPTGIQVSARQEKKQEQNRKIALELLSSQLWEIEEEKRLEKIGEARSAIGRNMRAEKIRTHNYPQNRVTDHRINRSWYNLDSIIEGNLEEVLVEIHRDL